VSIFKQVQTLVFMLFSGIIIGLILDVYYILRFKFKLKGYILAFLDIFYWLLAAFIFLSLLYYSNFGELRLYIYFISIFGFYLYFKFFSSFFKNIILAILNFFEKLFGFLINLFCSLVIVPLKNLFFFLKRLLLLFKLIIIKLVNFFILPFKKVFFKIFFKD